MRLGIPFSGPYPGEFDPVQMYQHIRHQTQTAHESNFEALFAVQHYLTGPTFQATVAILTGRYRLSRKQAQQLTNGCWNRALTNSADTDE